jgi:hypothetical protein
MGNNSSGGCNVIGRGEVLTCPLCRYRSRLDADGVSGLGVNVVMLNAAALVDRQLALRGLSNAAGSGNGRSCLNSSVTNRCGTAAAGGGDGCHGNDPHRIVPHQVQRLHPIPSRTSPDDRVIELPAGASIDGQPGPSPGTSQAANSRGCDQGRAPSADVGSKDDVGRQTSTDFLLTSQDIDYMFDTDYDGGRTTGSTAYGGRSESELQPVGTYVGRFGKLNNDAVAGHCRPGSFGRNMSALSCSWNPVHYEVLVVDRGGSTMSTVQLFAPNGDCLSTFQVPGGTGPGCFATADGDRLAVATTGGVIVCDRRGQVEKTLPLGGDVVALSAYRRGFVVAHVTRLSICERYRPTAVIRTIAGVQQPTGPVPFRNITDVATSVDKLCVVDSGVVYVLDAESGGRLQFVIQSSAPGGGGALRHPIGVAVALDGGGMIAVADAEARRVLQFGGRDGRLEGCLMRLHVFGDDDGGRGGGGAGGGDVTGARCDHVAVGPRGTDGRQLVYVAVNGPQLAEVRMYRV